MTKWNLLTSYAVQAIAALILVTVAFSLRAHPCHAFLTKWCLRLLLAVLNLFLSITFQKSITHANSRNICISVILIAPVKEFVCYFNS